MQTQRPSDKGIEFGEFGIGRIRVYADISDQRDRAEDYWSYFMKSKKLEIVEKCNAIFEDNRCELPAGHTRKHRQAGVSWTDAGAERYLKAAEKQKTELLAKSSVSGSGS